MYIAICEADCANCGKGSTCIAVGVIPDWIDSGVPTCQEMETRLVCRKCVGWIAKRLRGVDTRRLLSFLK